MKVPTGLKAYYLTAVNTGTGAITATEITGTIPANTAVLLVGEGGQTYNFADADNMSDGKAISAISINSSSSMVRK